MNRLAHEINRCARNHRDLSIILVDIDHFKSVNDRYGHLIGDAVLKRFAETLTTLSRGYDITGRYGGEEFVVALPEAGLHKAVQVAERMRECVAAATIPLPDGSTETVRVTASFGVAAKTVTSVQEADALIKEADDALYRAKEKGRNRVEASAGEMAPAA
jgi:two-component system, cell cycle response regulator